MIAMQISLEVYMRGGPVVGFAGFIFFERKRAMKSVFDSIVIESLSRDMNSALFTTERDAMN